MRLPILVINSNFGPILHRFRDTATYWLKLPTFATPLSFPRFPSEFRAAVKHEETKVTGLSSSEDRMILA